MTTLFITRFGITPSFTAWITLFFATDLQTLILWIATVVLTVTSLLLMVSLLKIKRQPANTVDTNQEADKSNRVLDAIWTIIPIIILALLLLLTYQSG